MIGEHWKPRTRSVLSKMDNKSVNLGGTYQSVYSTNLRNLGWFQTFLTTKLVPSRNSRHGSYGIVSARHWAITL
jgi:hypothetical protein